MAPSDPVEKQSAGPGLIKARLNPFRTSRTAAIGYKLPAAEWGRLRQRLAELRCRGALIGPHGSGKSTLSRTLAGEIEESGVQVLLLRLNEEKRQLDAADLERIRSAAAGQCLIGLDGAEQLGIRAWLRFRKMTRKFRGVIITAHRRMRMPVLWRCCTSPELLQELITELWPACPAVQDVAERYYRRHAGNLRGALRELYDRFPDP